MIEDHEIDNEEIRRQEHKRLHQHAKEMAEKRREELEATAEAEMTALGQLRGQCTEDSRPPREVMRELERVQTRLEHLTNTVEELAAHLHRSVPSPPRDLTMDVLRESAPNRTVEGDRLTESPERESEVPPNGNPDRIFRSGLAGVTTVCYSSPFSIAAFIARHQTCFPWHSLDDACREFRQDLEDLTGFVARHMDAWARTGVVAGAYINAGREEATGANSALATLTLPIPLLPLLAFIWRIDETATRLMYPPQALDIPRLDEGDRYLRLSEGWVNNLVRGVRNDRPLRRNMLKLLLRSGAGSPRTTTFSLSQSALVLHHGRELTRWVQECLLEGGLEGSSAIPANPMCAGTPRDPQPGWSDDCGDLGR